MSSARCKFLFFVLIFILKTHNRCYSDIRFHQKAVFSTKTPYFWERNDDESVEEDSSSFFDSPDATKSCQIFHINSLVRHGIRFPGLKWIKKMSEVHEKLTQAKIGEQLGFINKWNNPFPSEKEHTLASLGESELFSLGRRFGKRYKLLFEEEMDRLKYIVSSKQRTIDSLHAFHEGLMEILPDEYGKNDPMAVVDDNLLRFHAKCRKFYNEIENNDSALGEYFTFKSGPEMNAVVKAVSENVVGHRDDIVLNTDEVMTIHQICAFELAFFGKSDWCQVFTEQDMEVIDYLNDLKHYWQKAYGHKLSSDMSCPLVRHMFQEMDNAMHDFTDGEDHTVGVFRFAHAETLAPLYAALGLYKDSEPLMANNFNKHTNRLFRSSKILPFAGNIAFALYECDAENEEDDGEEESIYVMLYVNEEAVVIPACGETLCKYIDVRQFYSRFVDACNFDELCEVDTSNTHEHDEL